MTRPLVSMLALFLCGCSPRQTEKISPGGSQYLVTSVEQSQTDPGAYLCVVLEIHGTKGALPHRENTRASSTQRWSVKWLSEDEIVLDSSDVGSLKWRRQPDGSWAKNVK